MSGNAEPYGREGLPLEEARQRVVAALQPITARSTVPLEQALGRVSAADVLASAAVPGFRASIMDGYALGRATSPNLGHLAAEGSLRCRPTLQGTLANGEAIRILTGAQLQYCAGWVLPQELISVDGTSLQLAKEASDRPWIRPEDEECRAEDLLLAAGERLGAADLARLAGCGIAALTVAQQPRIGLLISGDELVPGTARNPVPSGRATARFWNDVRALGQSVTQRRWWPINPTPCASAWIWPMTATWW